MSNLINYTNKTSVIETKLRNIDIKALEMYNSGEHTTEEIEYFMKTSIVNALSSLGEPSMKTRDALTVPVFEDYKSMVNESVDDLNALINDCVNLYDSNKDTSQENEVFKSMVYGKIGLLSKNIEALEKTISVETVGEGYVGINETFGSTENSSGRGNAAINMLSGSLTLGVKKQDTPNEYDIEVMEGSNGYPGNTHQAFKTDREVVFEGEAELHADVNDMIDGNDDTWFEYEIFELSEEIINKVAGLGLEYQEGLSWVEDVRKLTLSLKVTLKQENECNTMSINPFLSKVKGSSASIIRKITVSSEDRTSSQTITNGSVFDSEHFINFDSQPVKHVLIELEQTVPYETTVGHFFYGMKNEETGEVSRTEGPLPKVESLGMKYSPKEKKFIQPRGYDEDGEKVVLEENRVKDELFGLHLKSHNCFKETLPAKRYLIGIRDLDISRQEYEETSTYLSKNFKTEERIFSVSLESDEYIPDSFGVREGWISYFISFDDGKEWLPIYPRHRSHAGPSTYRINSMNMSDSKDGNVKYIYRLYDSREITLKIELKRPEASIGNTPIVYSYSLGIRTGDETLD